MNADTCPHVGPDAKPPVHVFGIAPLAWLERLNTIEKNAVAIRVSYTRTGKVRQRKLKSDTPIVLMAVASHPSDPDAPSPERDRCQNLVVDAARARWGDRLRSVIAHVDESYYHLHLWIDDDGRPVKSLHMGHATAAQAAAAGLPRSAQGRAYKDGCAQLLAWHHATVGAAMGWRIASDAPKPRAPRAAVIAKRLRETEALEAEVSADAAWLVDAEAVARASIQAQADQVQSAREEVRADLARAEALKAKLQVEAEELADLRRAIADQGAIEALQRTHRAAKIARL